MLLTDAKGLFSSLGLLLLEFLSCFGESLHEVGGFALFGLFLFFLPRIRLCKESSSLLSASWGCCWGAQEVGEGGSLFSFIELGNLEKEDDVNKDLLTDCSYKTLITAKFLGSLCGLSNLLSTLDF